MSSLKLYLIIIDSNQLEEIFTLRELDGVIKVWEEKYKENSSITGLIHSGFSRPQIKQSLNLPAITNGRMLYSSAIRWSIPTDFYKIVDPIINISFDDELVPCYLALNKWGYVVDANEISSYSQAQNDKNDLAEISNKTIVEAAILVLKEEHNRPLNKDEIYAKIVEKGYYTFGAKKPVHALNVQLHRFAVDTEYSKSSKVPVFGLTDSGRFYLLDQKSPMPKGWVKTLAAEEPLLFQSAQEFNIFDEDSFQINRSEIPDNLCNELEQKRFEYLLPTVNTLEPKDLLSLAPSWLLERNINELVLTVRSLNVLKQKGINKISELSSFTYDDLRNLPNMGKKSIRDISHSIQVKIKQGFVENKSAPIEQLRNNIQLNQIDNDVEEAPQLRNIELHPLIHHLTRTVNDLTEVDRIILHGRLGFSGNVSTLEEMGGKLNVTRERIRQRQKKFVHKIISTEYWDDFIGLRIGQLLLDRKEPLILELLEVEDEWFKGFGDNYVYLSSVIQLFSENEIHVIEATGRTVITRITQKNWDALIKDLRGKLQQKVAEKTWNKSDIDVFFESCLSEHGAKELKSLLNEFFSEYLQFENENPTGKLITYGKSAESAVITVLAQAEGPLHFTEIAKRASEIIGKEVEERRAHSAVNKDGVWLFDRGTYGLIDHCPLTESQRHEICRKVELMLYQGPINKQWHSKNIIDELKKQFKEIPEALDSYVLRMCIENSPAISFLNRMVWARADSGLGSGDRIETTNSFIQILEEAGEPLSGKELKRRLSEIRDVPESMQIHGNERLVAVGPNMWGLSDWAV